jgi:hypothetical protein
MAFRSSFLSGEELFVSDGMDLLQTSRGLLVILPWRLVKDVRESGTMESSGSQSLSLRVACSTA